MKLSIFVKILSLLINLLLVVVCICFLGCKKAKNDALLVTEKAKNKALDYAKGFSITNYNGYKVLHITSPWANAKTSYKYVLVSKENASKTTFNTNEHDGIITLPIQKCVATSTTHISFLDAIDAENTVVGFPNTNYISSPSVRQRISNNKIVDLGKNENLNTEMLLNLKPDVVLAFSLNAVNKSLETIRSAKIPVIYIGEWTEASPLAKAEWIKVFGELFEKTEKADSTFNSIADNYTKAKQAIQTKTTMPTVFSGAMYKDIWYLPSGTSPDALFFKDACTNYLWKNTKGSGSLQLNFETVLNTAKSAEYWFNPFSMASLNDLKTNNVHYTQFDAFKNKKIYSFANTKGETGGILYYELGTLRPDIILKDIIKICHPELLPNHQLYFYKKLN